MKLLLARHGETDWNKENRVLGRSEIPLNDRGISQANQLVAKLCDEVIHAIYSSPLARAYFIGNLIAKNHSLKCVVDSRLVEMNFGIFEGAKRDDNEYLFEKWNLFSRFPEGESFLQVAGRVYPFLEEIKRKHRKDTVLIVTHNGICRIVTNYFIDMSVDEFVSFSMHNCEVKEFYL